MNFNDLQVDMKPKQIDNEMKETVIQECLMQIYGEMEKYENQNESHKMQTQCSTISQNII